MATIPQEVVQAELDGAWRTFGILLPELGIFPLLGLMGEIVLAQSRGEPFAALGTPVDEQDVLSRKQLGPAVLLERALRKRVAARRARELTRRVVLESSITFLKLNVPLLRKKHVLGLDKNARHRFGERLAKKFFNADVNLSFEPDESIAFTVHRCRFVELLSAVGELDMASHFCQGDAHFFEQHQPDVRMTRTVELSTGGPHCDFHFAWKK